MKKYKLLDGRAYPELIEGNTYNGDYIFSGEIIVQDFVDVFPNDWEEVTDKLV